MAEIILSCPHCPSEKSSKLYINVSMGVFNCFRCGFKGKIKTLHKYPDIISKLEEQLTLSEYAKLTSFKPLEVKNVPIFEDISPVREIIPTDSEYSYLESRGWSEEHINIYKPLISFNQSCLNRVILPVLDDDNNIIYYTARDITETSKNKYKNPTHIGRKTILFKSHLIESQLFPMDVVIGEGIFDMFKIPNGIGLLGKTISKENESQLLDIISNKSYIYICLDSGAESNILDICKKIYSWFPSKSIFYIDTTKYQGKDLGNLSEELTSIELLSWIKSNSLKYIPENLTDTIKTKILALSGN